MMNFIKKSVMYMEINFTDNSQEVLNALEQQSYRAMEECGLVAEGYAKLNAPVDTGALRNSISHATVEEGSKTTTYIGTNMEYAPYIEYGTGIHYDGGGRRTSWSYQDRDGNWHMTNGQRARPYLKPAITDHTGEYKKIIEQELKG